MNREINGNLDGPSIPQVWRTWMGLVPPKLGGRGANLVEFSNLRGVGTPSPHPLHSVQIPEVMAIG
jgi:hypothetical protein